MSMITAEFPKFFVFSTIMMLQNFLYFVLWWLYFNNFSSMNGWQFTDLATLMAVVAFSFGMASFFCDGYRHISEAVSTGLIDIYLTRPKPVLPALLMRRTGLFAMGDIIGGILFFLWLSGKNIGSLPLYLFLGIMGVVIIVSMGIILNSMSFWAKDTDRFSNQMQEFFMILTTLPQHGFSWMIKMVLFTAVPAGFVGLLPVEILKDFSLPKLIIIAAAACLWTFLAIYIFSRGLRYYNSSSQFTGD